MHLRHRDMVLLWLLLLTLFILAIPIALDASVFGFDGRIEEYITAGRTPGLTSFFSFVTLLGSSALIAGLTLAGWLYFVYFIPRGFAYAVGLLFSVAGSALSELMLKDIVHRARPDMALFWEPTFSFPSGHAAAAVALYGFLAFCIWHIARQRTAKWAGIIALSALILGIGFSRLYLGEHFPADVLGGYILGTFWVILGMHAFAAIRSGEKRRMR